MLLRGPHWFAFLVDLFPGVELMTWGVNNIESFDLHGLGLVFPLVPIQPESEDTGAPCECILTDCVGAVLFGMHKMSKSDLKNRAEGGSSRIWGGDDPK